MARKDFSDFEVDITKYSPAPRKDPLSYPGKRPDFSFLFHEDSILPIIPEKTQDLGKSSVLFSNGDKRELDSILQELHAETIEERYVVIGYGSNANPAQLSVKFKDLHRPIPVFKGTLTGYDVVYASFISPYGAIPATIDHSDETKVEVWINFLDEEQMRIMDKTEGRNKSYWLTKIEDEIKLENGLVISPLYVYISTMGILPINERSVRINDIKASNVKFNGMNQNEIISYFLSSFIKREKLEALKNSFHRIIEDDKLREKFNEFLNDLSLQAKIQFSILDSDNLPVKMKELSKKFGIESNL